MRHAAHMSAHRFISGMINRDRKVGFERLLYRATRGNLFMQTESVSELMKDPITVIDELCLL